MTIFQITITDEFNKNYVFQSNDYTEIIKIANDWLSHNDETPLYSILIDVNP